MSEVNVADVEHDANNHRMRAAAKTDDAPH